MWFKGPKAYDCVDTIQQVKDRRKVGCIPRGGDIPSREAHAVTDGGT